MFFSACFADIQKIPLNDYLSLDEQDSYANCLVAKRKDWLAGRYAAKKVLQHYVKKDCSQDVLLKDIIIKSSKKNGVTFFCPGNDLAEGLCLSISHHEGQGVALLANGPVGVDIEHPRIFKKEMLCEFLTPNEQAFLAKFSVSEQASLATLFWSFKESYLKALRKGLIIHPRTVEIILSDNWQFQGLRHNGQIVAAEGSWSKFSDHYFLTSICIVNTHDQYGNSI